MVTIILGGLSVILVAIIIVALFASAKGEDTLRNNAHQSRLPK